MTLTALPDIPDQPQPDPARDAEQALIGAILTNPHWLDLITPQDLYNPDHATIWDACNTLRDTGQPIDPITVANHLHTTGHLTRIGGAATLHTLIEACPVAANAPAWAAIVTNDAARRRLADTAIALHQAAHHSHDTPTAIADRARTTLDQIATPTTTTTTPGQTMPALTDSLEHPAAAGIPTPWPDLTRTIHGLQPGRLYVIGGRPGTGKSMLAQAIATHASTHGAHTYLATVEMGAHEVTMRMLAAASGLYLDRLQSGNLHQWEWDQISAATPTMLDLRVHIDDAAHQTPATIRAGAHDIQKRHGLGAIIVDYLQLLTPTSGRDRSREQEVSEHSRSLKLLAKDLNVPVILLSQLNRDMKTRADKRPTMTDLRESGAIEQDADSIWLLHHPDEETPTRLTLHVVKSRNGAAGDTIELLQQGWVARIIPAPTTRPTTTTGDDHE